MKNKFLFLLLLCSPIFFSSFLYLKTDNTQLSGLVTYKVNCVFSKEEIEEKFNTLDEEQQQYRGVMMKLDQRMRDLEYELKFNHTRSLFKHKELLQEEEDEMERKLALINISGSAIYFKDLKKQRKIKQQEYAGQLVNVKKRFDSYDWTILNETKTIGKYECKKASTIITEMTTSGEEEREIIVWFAPDISVSFGPLGIGGLPGMILEFRRGGNYYLSASEATLGDDIIKEKDIALPKGGNEISEEEWDEFHKKENERIRQRSN